jgi:dihydrofolate reductase
MRRVVMYHLLSLDGVAEEPSDWVFDFDERCAENLARIIATQDSVLLGRHQYDEWAAYWPEANDELFAPFINGVTKYVFTSGAPTVAWTNSTVVNSDAAEYVSSLKREPGGDIGVHGSIELSRSLLAAGLVDELQLLVVPTIAGSGRRLFADGDALRRLELVDVERTSSGAVLVAYRFPTATKKA